jgi:hypothetical protein
MSLDGLYGRLKGLLMIRTSLPNAASNDESAFYGDWRLRLSE